MSVHTAKMMPSKCVVYRPSESGELKVVDVVAPALTKKHAMSDWEPDVIIRNIRAIAIQETGETMFAGYTTELEKHAFAEKWMAEHPEHRGVEFSKLRGI